MAVHRTSYKPDYKASEHALTDNASTDIDIGSKLTDRSFYIDYDVERGSLFSSGKLTVLYKDATPITTFSQSAVIGDATGITFAFKTSGNNIVMTATLTNTGDDATLKLSTKITTQ